MECIFNRYVPPSTDSLIIIKPIGQTFINGLSSSYDETFPPALQPYIDESMYRKCIIDLNETLINYWPCFCARAMGYFCCLCTMGLSFLMPNICISDAEETYTKQLEQYNNSLFNPRGLDVKLRKKCSTSWLEVKITNVQPRKNPADSNVNINLIDTAHEMTD